MVLYYSKLTVYLGTHGIARVTPVHHEVLDVQVPQVYKFTRFFLKK